MKKMFLQCLSMISLIVLGSCATYEYSPNKQADEYSPSKQAAQSHDIYGVFVTDDIGNILANQDVKVTFYHPKGIEEQSMQLDANGTTCFVVPTYPDILGYSESGVKITVVYAEYGEIDFAASVTRHQGTELAKFHISPPLHKYIITVMSADQGPIEGAEIEIHTTTERKSYESYGVTDENGNYVHTVLALNGFKEFGTISNESKIGYVMSLSGYYGLSGEMRCQTSVLDWDNRIDGYSISFVQNMLGATLVPYTIVDASADDGADADLSTSRFLDRVSSSIQEVSVMMICPQDYLKIDWLESSEDESMREAILDILPRLQLVTDLAEYKLSLRSIHRSTFKGSSFIALQVEDTSIYNTLKTSRRQLAALTLDDVLSNLLKTLSELPQDVGVFDGFDITACRRMRDFSTESVSEVVRYRFILESDYIKKYLNSDITGQDLMERATILMDGDRIKVTVH
jgi:hypothetical protein